MKNIPGISDAEWVVMELFWQHAPLSAGEIHQRLQPHSTWHLKTVHTLIGRLVKKGALRREKVHRVNVFHPLVERAACLHEASDSFLQRYFQANMAPMLANYLDNEEVTEEELEEMRQLLASKQKSGLGKKRS